MASTGYTYSISTDFSAGVSGGRLQQEILDDATITKTLERVDTDGDDCDIWFADALTTGEETALDAVVAAHSGHPSRKRVDIITDPMMESVEASSSVVVSNGRPAIEIQEDADGWGTVLARWPLASLSVAKLVVTIKFILKSTGTGTVARIAARAKAEGAGDDSAEAWADTQYNDVTVSHTTLGEVFEGELTLDASTFGLNDSVALQVGRNGSHANDTLDQPIQIIGLQAGAE